jgi:hypothetical protein
LPSGKLPQRRQWGSVPQCTLPLGSPGGGFYFMTEKEQIDHFANELDNLVNRFRTEYEMTYASIVGILQMKIHLLCGEAEDREDEV